MNNEIKDIETFINEKLNDGFCISECAELLYGAGYRKQSDTVKEFAEKVIEDIEQAIDSNKKVMDKRGYGDSYLTCLGKVTACQGIIDKINELSAEYGVEVGE